jgi:hypothetical protein
MKRWSTIAALAGSLLVLGGPAFAQESDNNGGEQRRFALGVGAGLVEGVDEVETYLMASLRIAVHGRTRGGRAEQGVDAYIEPEIGYWKDSDTDGSDLLLGVNLIGVVPFGNVDSFFGAGAGIHSIDAELLGTNGSGSDTKFGTNAQFGIDVYMSRNVSLFGAGRFDLVQDAPDQVQGKVYLGIRGRF